MKRVQTLMMGLSALVLVGAFATPTLSAKTILPDEELDQVTAAGQPKISQAYTGVGTATATNFQVNVFAAHIGGQENLTALTLNNIFGENQVANGVNIQSGADNSGIQTNEAIQSWGSAKAYDSVTVAGAPGGPGGGVVFCPGLIPKCHAGGGGDASEGKIGLLWAFGDEIADARSNLGPATAANVVVNVVAGSFDDHAQSGLTALTVNNIVGFNQVANGVNISSGGVSGSGIEGASAGSGTTQRNKVEQWRGSPKGWTDAPTFF